MIKELVFIVITLIWCTPVSAQLTPEVSHRLDSLQHLITQRTEQQTPWTIDCTEEGLTASCTRYYVSEPGTGYVEFESFEGRNSEQWQLWFHDFEPIAYRYRCRQKEVDQPLLTFDLALTWYEDQAIVRSNRCEGITPDRVEDWMNMAAWEQRVRDHYLISLEYLRSKEWVTVDEVRNSD